MRRTDSKLPSLVGSQAINLVSCGHIFASQPTLHPDAYHYAIVGRLSLVFDDSSRDRPSGECGRSTMLGKFVHVCDDDILIFSETIEVHLVPVRCFLETLKYLCLCVESNKCQFGQNVCHLPRPRDFGIRHGNGTL